MQSAYCRALAVSGGIAFPIKPMGMVEANPYYRRANNAATIGALVATPGFMRSHIDALDASFEQTGKEMHDFFVQMIEDQGATEASASQFGRFLSNVWTPAKTNWEEFKSRHSKWFDLMWGGTVDVIEQQRIILAQLRAQAKVLGMDFQSPEPPAPVKNAWDSIIKLIKIIGVAIIGAIGVWIAGNVYTTIRRG